MPGGSVNGKPFRESSDSYSKTGIPCGNPRRFHSRDVVRMEPGTRSRSRPIDGPVEEIETEGQRQLQTMIHQQLETNVTVKQQLGRKREFSCSVEFSPVTGELAGMRSLADFQSLGDVDAYIEEMKSYGLTHEEILFKLRADDAQLLQEDKKSRLSNPEYQEARLGEINEKIAQKKQQLSEPDQFANVKPISRHEMDLEKAIATASSQNRFLHTTLVKQRVQGPATSASPMNAIPEILESISSKQTSFRKHRKTEKHAYKSECKLECCNPVATSQCSECEKLRVQCGMSHDPQLCDHGTVLATCMEKPEDYVLNDQTPKPTPNEKKVPAKSTSYVVRVMALEQPNKEQNGGTDTDNETAVKDMNDTHEVSNEQLREIDHVEPIPDNVINKYKLSASEVKSIPRFENYTPGKPNNVLFVKNLSAKITEEDLASLFIGFQSGPRRIVFKLLNGKMKGQAFVTFPDADLARKALELVHGYQFKGKPVIVQYGKKQTV